MTSPQQPRTGVATLAYESFDPGDPGAWVIRVDGVILARNTAIASTDIDAAQAWATTTTAPLRAAAEVIATDMPALTRPCPECTTPDYDLARQRAQSAYAEWHQRESAGYRAWVATREAESHPNAYDPGLWRASSAFEALGPEPELLADRGCVECDWTAVVATPAGRQLLDFLRLMGYKAATS